MKLSSLHLLLTYQCTFECDHCFVWGSPWQSGTMTLDVIRRILQQAKRLATVDSIYFEGGEPFLYYPLLLKAIRLVARSGLRVGIVTNSYWATDASDAMEWLKPLAGLVDSLTISSDLYHFSETMSRQARNAQAAAARLRIPLDLIAVAQPDAVNAASAAGQLPAGESSVMYRGRAADKLAGQAVQHAWSTFAECPHEDLREPGRVHVDPFGNVHICQGICLGNLFKMPLSEICEGYAPDLHPITGPLLHGGPAELVRRYALPHAEACADACHLCYQARSTLRTQFPDILGPDQMYGVASP